MIMRPIRSIVISLAVLAVFISGNSDVVAKKDNTTSSTTTLLPIIPDSPRDFGCGKDRNGKQILANDGWNYKCGLVGKQYVWIHIDCVFGGITCITLPPNPIAPSIGESFVYPNLGGVIIEFQTSTGDSTRKYVEIATDSRFENIVFTGDHSTVYDSSWRCDVRMCGEIFITNGSPMNAGDKLIGVSSISGTVWARVTVSNNRGSSSKTFGLVFPGPQMVTPTTSTSTTSTSTTIANPTSTSIVNLKSIICKKGLDRQKISSVNPKCPSGWRRIVK
jgi:hypothetical protein